LRDTIRYFGSTENAEELCRIQFDFWSAPPIFEDAKLFFEQCPFPIYVVSNIDTADLNAALAVHGLQPTGTVTSEEVRYYKPRKEIFEYALNKFGLNPQDVIHIGDSLTSDVQGAQAAWIQAVWLNRNSKPIPQGVKAHIASLSQFVAELEDITCAQSKK
jgi:2-haloacid dehalogenase/putative hydrolase of the HAD superfamily